MAKCDIARYDTTRYGMTGYETTRYDSIWVQQLRQKFVITIHNITINKNRSNALNNINS